MKTFKILLAEREVLVNADNKHKAIVVLQEHVGSVGDNLTLKDAREVDYLKSNRPLVWGLLPGYEPIPGLSGTIALDRYA